MVWYHMVCNEFLFKAYFLFGAKIKIGDIM